LTRTHENVRCPVCTEPALRIQYGLSDGPPEPGVVLGGCLISPNNPDFLCEECHATWRVRRDGSIQLIDSGVS
jgi:hypothetical protein